MTAERDGAVIEEGPQDWQVLQQRSGAADVQLSGKWEHPEFTTPVVRVRAVREDSGASVAPALDWIDAEMGPGRAGARGCAESRPEGCIGSRATSRRMRPLRGSGAITGT